MKLIFTTQKDCAVLVNLCHVKERKQLYVISSAKRGKDNFEKIRKHLGSPKKIFCKKEHSQKLYERDLGEGF